jgi:hypothetical protein
MVEIYKISATLTVRDELNAALALAIANARKLAAVLRDVQKASNSAFAGGGARAGAHAANGMTGAGGGAAAATSAASAMGSSIVIARMRVMTDQAERMSRATSLTLRNSQALERVTNRGLPPIWHGYPQVPGGGAQMRLGGPRGVAPHMYRPTFTGYGGGGGIPGGPGVTYFPPGAGGPAMLGGAGGPALLGGPPGGGGGGGGGPPGGGGGGGGGFGRFGGLIDGYLLMHAGEIGTRFGEGVMEALGKMLEAGGQLVRQQNLLRATGMSDEEFNMADRVAWAATKAMPQFSYADNIKKYGELRSVLSPYTADGTLAQREQMALASQTGVNQLSAISGAVTGKATDSNKAIRAAEMMGYTVDRATGKLDPARLKQFLDYLAAAEITTHGLVNEKTLFQAAQTGSLAMKNLSLVGLQKLTPLLSEQGGFRTGTALQSMFQQMIGGVMPERILKDWSKLGLLNMKDVTPTKTGARIGEHAFDSMSGMESDPIGTLQKVLLPALVAHGITNPLEQQKEIFRLMSRNTTQRMTGNVLAQLVQIAKDVVMQQQVPSSQSTIDNFNAHDLQFNLNNMAGAWTSFSEIFGKAVIPVVIPALRAITEALMFFGGEMKAHPTIAKDILITAGIIGGLALIVGTVATVFGGLLIAFTALSAAGVIVTMTFGTFVGIMAAAAIEIPIAIAGIVFAFEMLTNAKVRNRVVNWINGIQTAIFAGVSAGVHWVEKQVGALGMDLGHAIWGAISSAFAWVKHEIATMGGIFGGPSKPGGLQNPGPSVIIPPAAATGTGNGSSRTGPQHHDLTAQIAHGVAKGLHGAVLVATHGGAPLAALVTQHQVQAMRRPNRGTSGFDNRQAPRTPGHAIAVRG